MRHGATAAARLLRASNGLEKTDQRWRSTVLVLFLWPFVVWQMEGAARICSLFITFIASFASLDGPIRELEWQLPKNGMK